MTKIERLDPHTRHGAALHVDHDGDIYLNSIGWGHPSGYLLIPSVDVAKAMHHVLGEWIKTKEAEDEG